MQALLVWVRSEPARVFGIVQAAVWAAVAFGLDLDAGQQAAVLGLAAAVLGGAEGVRASVSPTPRVRAQLAERDEVIARLAAERDEVIARLAADAAMPGRPYWSPHRDDEEEPRHRA